MRGEIRGKREVREWTVKFGEGKSREWTVEIGGLGSKESKGKLLRLCWF